MVDNKHSHGVENEATRVEQLAMMGRLKLESAGQWKLITKNWNR